MCNVRSSASQAPFLGRLFPGMFGGETPCGVDCSLPSSADGKEGAGGVVEMVHRSRGVIIRSVLKKHREWEERRGSREILR